jgi:hypothetical protein
MFSVLDGPAFHRSLRLGLSLVMLGGGGFGGIINMSYAFGLTPGLATTPIS